MTMPEPAEFSRNSADSTSSGQLNRSSTYKWRNQSTGLDRIGALQHKPLPPRPPRRSSSPGPGTVQNWVIASANTVIGTGLNRRSAPHNLPPLITPQPTTTNGGWDNVSPRSMMSYTTAACLELPQTEADLATLTDEEVKQLKEEARLIKMKADQALKLADGRMNNKNRSSTTTTASPWNTWTYFRRVIGPVLEVPGKVVQYTAYCVYGMLQWVAYTMVGTQKILFFFPTLIMQTSWQLTCSVWGMVFPGATWKGVINTKIRGGNDEDGDSCCSGTVGQ